METFRRSPDLAHKSFTTRSYGPPVSARKIAASGLVAVSAGILTVLAVGGVFVPLGFVFGIVPLAGAALLLVRSRWTALSAGLLGGLFLFGALRASATAARLADPGNPVPFAASLVQLAGASLALVAGLIATFRRAKT